MFLVQCLSSQESFTRSTVVGRSLFLGIETHRGMCG